MRPFETCGNEKAWEEYWTFMSFHRRGSHAVRAYRRAVFFEFEREEHDDLPGVRSRRQRIPFVVKTVAPKPGERILEVGCGFGPYLHRCALGGSTCVGVDLSPGLLQEARTFLTEFGTASRCLLACGDGLALPFPSETFHKVLCSDVIEHIPLPLQRGFLAELRRVVRPRGEVFLQTPNLLRAQVACYGRKWLAMLSGRDWRRYAVPWNHDGGHTGISSLASLQSRIGRIARPGDSVSVCHQLPTAPAQRTGMWASGLGAVGDLLSSRALITWKIAYAAPSPLTSKVVTTCPQIT